jgi:DNA-binding CsgD family transcriptional regulator
MGITTPTTQSSISETISNTEVEALGAQGLSDTQIMINAGLSPQETEVALLLIQGDTQSEVARKLHLKAADMKERVESIRVKLNVTEDKTITMIVSKYHLTKRETDMLHYLRQGKSIEEIAEEIFLSEETVRTHVRHLMGKIPVKSRYEIEAWIRNFDVN